MKSLVLASMLLLAMVGVSYGATATWTNDTVADLAGTRIYRAPGTCALPGAFVLVDTVNSKTQTSEVLPNPTVDGAHCHRATHFDTAGNESLFSNTSEFNYNVVPPKAPGVFSVIP